jgi:hypothetical protein
MTTYTKYSINANGIAQIANFLKINHKKGAMISGNTDMLYAWAADAEFQLAEGNPASIEIRSFDSVHGYTQTIDISNEGLDSEQIEIDE